MTWIEGRDAATGRVNPVNGALAKLTGCTLLVEAAPLAEGRRSFWPKVAKVCGAVFGVLIAKNSLCSCQA